MTQYLAETREGLLAMVRLAQAQDDVLVQVAEAGRTLLLNICLSAAAAVGLQLRVAAGARHDAPHAGAGRLSPPGRVHSPPGEGRPQEGSRTALHLP